MKLFEFQFLLEMGAKKACSVCGHSMANFHFYRNGGWYCKTTSLSAPAPGADVAACKAALAAGKAPRVSGNASTPSASTPTPASATPGASAPAATKTTPRATPTPATTSNAAAVATPAAPSYAQGSIQEKIGAWLNYQEVENYTINADNSVDINGSLYLNNLRYKKLPVVFNNVSGDIGISGGLLETLDGLPSKISGDLSLSGIKLDSWSGCPTTIHSLTIHECTTPAALPQFQNISGAVHLVDVKGLDSIKGLPDTIGGLDIDNISIKTLEGVPKQINGTLTITCTNSSKSKLTSLTELKNTTIAGRVKIQISADVGQSSPIELPPSFNTNKSISLVGHFSGRIAFPSEIDGDLILESPYNMRNAQKDVEVSSWPSKVNGDLVMDAVTLDKIQKVSKVIREINGIIHIKNSSSPSTSGTYTDPGTLTVGPLLGLTQIKGVKSIDLDQNSNGKVTKLLQTTLNRVIAGDIDMFEAQELLIDAGLSKQARL